MRGSFSPSMRVSSSSSPPPPLQPQLGSVESSALVDRATMETRIAQIQTELVAAAAAAAKPSPAISPEQLAHLLARLDAIHTAKLIADEVRACPEVKHPQARQEGRRP